MTTRSSAAPALPMPPAAQRTWHVPHCARGMCVTHFTLPERPNPNLHLCTHMYKPGKALEQGHTCRPYLQHTRSSQWHECYRQHACALFACSCPVG
jgi:hypothetical protein